MSGSKLVKLGAAIAFLGSIPLMLYAEFGPRDANPVGLGMLMVASWLAGGGLAIVGAIQRWKERAPLAIGASEPPLGRLERTMFGSWDGEFAFGERRVSVTYVAEPADSVPRAEIRRAVLEIVERVARDEEKLRRTAAQAWLGSFQEECPAARGWDEERLAQSFTLASIILGNTHPTFILAYATTLPVDKQPPTWFNADGTLSHISGNLRPL